MKEQGTYLWVESFLSFKSSDDDLTIEETYARLRDGGHLPDGFVPFANDVGNNIICLECSTGSIYVIYMDLGDPLKVDGAVRIIARSFATFVEGLTGLDEEDI